jgi:hypothetical protein
MNGGIVQAHYEVKGFALIQQVKININAKILNRTLNGIDLIVGMDCLKAMQADIRCGQGVGDVQVNGRTRKLRPVQEKQGDGHMVSCSAEQLRNAGSAEVLSPKQATKLLKQGATSWLMLVQPNQQEVNQAGQCVALVFVQRELLPILLLGFVGELLRL